MSSLSDARQKETLFHHPKTDKFHKTKTRQTTGQSHHLPYNNLTPLNSTTTPDHTPIPARNRLPSPPRTERPSRTERIIFTRGQSRRMYRVMPCLNPLHTTSSSSRRSNNRLRWRHNPRYNPHRKKKDLIPPNNSLPHRRMFPSRSSSSRHLLRHRHHHLKLNNVYRPLQTSSTLRINTPFSHRLSRG